MGSLKVSSWTLVKLEEVHMEASSKQQKPSKTDLTQSKEFTLPILTRIFSEKFVQLATLVTETSSDITTGGFKNQLETICLSLRTANSAAVERSSKEVLMRCSAFQIANRVVTALSSSEQSRRNPMNNHWGNWRDNKLRKAGSLPYTFKCNYVKAAILLTY